MQISLGRKGDYAVRATLALALSRDADRVKARELALETGVPEKYLPQVLATLIRAGLVGSVAGPDGGYYLARPPSDITLRAVVEAAEGPIRSERCVLRGGDCDGTCILHDHWQDAQGVLIARLDATTFADLVERDGADVTP
jgi:Rrf2 family protein